MLIDTHCHLDDHLCPEGSEGPIERARAAGVGAFVCIGVGGASASRAAVSLSEREPDVVATVGVHPHDAASADASLESELETLARSERVVAVGEIGLDYHYDHSPREVQREVFRRWIAIAKQLKKPIVVHTRSAAAETLELLRSEGARDVGGVIHCFSEERVFAQAALDLDFDISFSGIVTFKSARAIQDVAAWAPRDRILVETDSPYLSPVPLRGKRNEPAHVVHTARFIAELRGVAFDDLALETTQNARRRFGAPLAAAVTLAAKG